MGPTRQETPSDGQAVEALLDLCFAPGREALSSYRLREGVAPVPELCLLIKDGFGSVAGSIRHWPILAGGSPALLLGPLAVHPTRQGEGLGAILVGESLGIAASLGWRTVVMVGDFAYYRRFGFKKAPGLQYPPPVSQSRVLYRHLGEGGLPAPAGKVSRFLDFHEKQRANPSRPGAKSGRRGE